MRNGQLHPPVANVFILATATPLIPAILPPKRCDGANGAAVWRLYSRPRLEVGFDPRSQQSLNEIYAFETGTRGYSREGVIRDRLYWAGVSIHSADDRVHIEKP